jgi:hypothetical protein
MMTGIASGFALEGRWLSAKVKLQPVFDLYITLV